MHVGECEQIGNKLGGIAVMQEIFLLAFCAAVTSLCRTPDALRAVLRTWCLAATAWASALVLAVLVGLPALSGLRFPWSSSYVLLPVGALVALVVLVAWP